MIPLLRRNRNDSSVSARSGRAHSAIILLLFLLSGLIVLSVIKLTYFKQEQSTVPSEYRFRQSEATSPHNEAGQMPIEAESEEVPADSVPEPAAVDSSSDPPRLSEP